MKCHAMSAVGRRETFSRMVNWLATLVKLPAEIGQLGWQSLVSRLAIRTETARVFNNVITSPTSQAPRLRSFSSASSMSSTANMTRRYPSVRPRYQVRRVGL
jgi:hypothetical protein